MSEKEDPPERWEQKWRADALTLAVQFHAGGVLKPESSPEQVVRTADIFDGFIQGGAMP